MNLIKSSLSNLKGHKLRVFVTLLWIIMGITSVILVSSIGNGLKKQVSESVSEVNSNKAQIRFEPTDYNMMSMSAFLKPFTNSDLEELSFVEGVEKIGPAKDDFDFGSMYSDNAIFDKKSTYIDVSEFKKDSEIKSLYGRSFGFDDEDRNVIMITEQNAIDLFTNPESAIGKGITLSGHVYEVIGIVDESSVVSEDDNTTNMFSGMSNYTYVTAYMPKKALDGLMNQFSYPQDIYAIELIASKGYDVIEVANTVMNKLYELHPDIDGSYLTDDPAESTMVLDQMVSKINLFVSLITGISMFVGGVGVMNIMYVSVMERQREIGIRRAIGAKPSAILFQFLVEAVFITVCGGILGVIVGFIVVNYASNYLPFEAIPNANSFFFASLATVITGIIFGIVPAIKASRLDPIKAIYK